MITALWYYCILFLLFELPGADLTKHEQPVNKFVQYKARVDKHAYARGTKGTLSFTFRPQKGIHINLEPGLSFTFDSSSGILSAGKLEIPKDKKTNFLLQKKPVKQNFLIPENIKPGTVIMKGILTYYYCSDAEGWCSRFRQPVEISIEVTD